MADPHTPRDGSTAGRRPITLAGTMLLALTAAACSSAGSAPSSQSTPKPPRATAGHHVVISASRPRWRLRAPASRLVALPVGRGVLLAGGLTQSGASSNAVLRLDLATGRMHTVGTVPDAFHDAAAATIAGHAVIFGGGSATSTDTVQSFGENGARRGRIIGKLPEPRSDLSAVTIGGQVYVLGGYTGLKQLSDVLETSDGKAFTTIATLPVTVRYAAVVAVGSTIWVFGGEHGKTPVRDIQRIDTKTGRARVVGQLPAARSEASAVLVAGRVLVAGGRGPNGRAVDTVQELDRGGSGVHTVAHLASPIADAATIVAGKTAYLLGGETSAAVATVQILTVRFVSDLTSGPPAAAP